MMSNNRRNLLFYVLRPLLLFNVSQSKLDVNEKRRIIQLKKMESNELAGEKKQTRVRNNVVPMDSFDFSQMSLKVFDLSDFIRFQNMTSKS